MATRKKTTISDILGWLMGTGCIILSMRHMETADFESARNWQMGGWFGFAIIILTSWTRKTRNEASDDMVEMNGEAVDNPPPKPEARHSMTLHEVKKLRQEGAYSPDKTSPRDGDSEGSSAAAFNGLFGLRAFTLITIICALLAHYITSSPSIPKLVAFLISPGSMFGPQAIPRYGDAVANPGAPPLFINCLYYGAIFWFLLFRRRT